MENTSMTSLAPHFESILDTLSDGVFISDAEGTTLFVNKMYETLTGLRQGEIRGKNIRTLVQQGIFDKVVNPQIVETGKSATHVQQLANGKRLVLTGYPVFDDKGQLCLVVTTTPCGKKHSGRREKHRFILRQKVGGQIQRNNEQGIRCQRVTHSNPDFPQGSLAVQQGAHQPVRYREHRHYSETARQYPQDIDVLQSNGIENIGANNLIHHIGHKEQQHNTIRQYKRALFVVLKFLEAGYRMNKNIE